MAIVWRIALTVAPEKPGRLAMLAVPFPRPQKIPPLLPIPMLMMMGWRIA
jgi:hypothetical protein